MPPAALISITSCCPSIQSVIGIHTARDGPRVNRVRGLKRLSDVFCLIRSVGPCFASARDNTCGMGTAVEEALRGPLETVRTGGDGRFVFDSLGPFQYTLRATAAGYQEGSQDVMVKRGRRNHTLVALVRLARISGTVTDTQGNPLAGARLTVRSLEGQSPRKLTSGFSGEDGTFEINDVVPASEMQVIVEHEGLSAWYSGPFEAGPGSSVS